ncbi:glucokinase [Elizabethkingia sp. JS20170427COW]|uniref:glucokinase n=1 Tax=Elizabethkingia sp. JS20170427COW TaxID=2583851 RepID=UPI001110CBCE|nr:glucokinase [Elizabethkingia sp. JS20170427COW]QCX53808.1 glucokinase [Elizabethkingia sp. JS20170427COW]
MNSTKFPLYLAGINKSENQNLKIIAADIGGTKTNIAWYIAQNSKLLLQEEATYASKEYSSFLEIVQDFIKNHHLEGVDVVSIGIAGPVVEGRCVTTNLPWNLDKNELSSQLGISRVEMINDLEATAYGLVEVNDGYLEVIHEGTPSEEGNVAILAPGTGLGEAGLFWDGEALRPFATEGGHSDFSPRNKLEIELYEYLHSIYSIVTWEHVISGQGIYNIYRFLRDVKKHPEPAWLTQKFEQEKDYAAVISHTAMRELDSTCTLAMEMFVEFMAREATNLTLKLKATRGLILGGGIPPKIFSLLNKDQFYNNFIVSDKLGHILKNVPIYLNLNAKTALIGAAYYGAFSR